MGGCPLNVGGPLLSAGRSKMTALDHIARRSRQYSRGIFTPQEFATSLSDSFAGSPDLQIKDAAEVAALIPAEVRPLVLRQIEAALAPGYLRQAFHLAGRPRTKEEEQADAFRETEREKIWAAALRPLLLV